MPEQISPAQNKPRPISVATASEHRRPPVHGSGRMLIAATVIFFIMTGAAWFSASTWIRFSNVTSSLWKIAPLVLVGSFVPVSLISFRFNHILLRVAGVLTAAALGFLNFAILAAALCWFAWGIARLANVPFEAHWLAIVLYGLAASLTGYGLINASRLRVTRATVRLPNLPVAWRGREVVLVSDVHVGNIRGRAFVRRIVQRIQKLNPAAVFISGDMFDGAKVEPDFVLEPWAELRPPAGTYFVSGNHDEFSERAPLLAAIRQVGIRVLNNEKIEVDGLQIIGVHDGETHDQRLFREILNRAALDRQRPSILLAHQPSNLVLAEQAGVSLQLSGHTHGGQFWPWSLVVRRMYGQFGYGLHALGHLQVFTSNGAGTWGPPMRLGTRSEVVLLTLE